ncbi:MAG: 30S ribosomal protein S3 [Candidatus Dadabacteria bacterium]|nr:MAG: 30S ribosomal protein S3 [Candidatus Dadabacteria bacterium]
MGQKVHPIGFRVGITRDWDARWYAEGPTVAEFLHEDEKIRRFIKERLYSAGVARIEIERPGAQVVTVKIHTARPGLAIGRKGEAIEALREEVAKLINREVQIEIKEVPRPETSAQLVAEAIAVQLERRVAFRRAMKKAISNALKFGVEGIKVRTAGRLGGADMARIEWYRVGRLPLQTLRADIDYGFAEAKTKYGVIGVKVWVFLGEQYQSGRAGLTGESRS